MRGGCARSASRTSTRTTCERIIAETGVAPVLNQVELHPWLPQAELRAFDAERGIRTEAWSPLARGRVLGTPLLDDLADKHGRTPAQIVLRWHVELGNVVIPKASSPERLRENLDVFDFALDARRPRRDRDARDRRAHRSRPRVRLNRRPARGRPHRPERAAEADRWGRSAIHSEAESDRDPTPSRGPDMGFARRNTVSA